MYCFKKHSKGFTLLELIIVITIIGILMGFSLAYLRSTQDKARIASAQQFSQTIKHTLGAYAIGIWKFEDIESGGRLIDNSGYSYHGINHGATLAIGIRGNCLEFDGSSDYVEIPDSGLMNNEKMTIEAWIYPRDISSLQMIVSKFELDKDYGLGIKNGRLYVWYGQGGDYTKELGLVKTNKWQHIAVVFKGWDSYNAYIDGRYVGSDLNTSPQRATTTANVEIGRAGSLISGNYFDGLIDEVRIYTKALPVGEIRKHYVQKRDRYKELTLEF